MRLQATDSARDVSTVRVDVRESKEAKHPATALQPVERMIQEALVLPNEDHLVDMMMNACNQADRTGEQRRAKVKLLLRSFYMAQR